MKKTTKKVTRKEVNAVTALAHGDKVPAASKPAPAPAKKEVTRGFTYQLTAKGLEKLAEAKGQQAILFAVLKKIGKARRAQLVDAVAKKIKTRQPLFRVIGYYLVSWQDAGFLKAN